jgi:hypothetical protein
MNIDQEGIKGGIEDYNDKPDEYCFKVNTEKNIFILCTNTNEEKASWMNSIFKLKELKDTNFTKESSAKHLAESIGANGLSQDVVEKIKGVTEPTWIPIGEWSECSKPCGGGKTYLQRICALPNGSNGGTCSGDKTLEQDCNAFPCIENEITAACNNNNIDKFIPFPKKQSRYEHCIIKEGDLAILITDGSLKGTKIPSRAVMTNTTLALYSSDVILD